MKCISVRQPWADMIIEGKKHYETRSWSTKYRGPLLIHASSFLDNVKPEERHLHLFGYLIGVVNLKDVIPTGRFIPVNRKPRAVSGINGVIEITQEEWCAGNFNPGRWAFEFVTPRRFPEPLKSKGRQSIFTTEYEC